MFWLTNPHICATMSCICPTVFSQTEDGGERPGELTQNNEDCQEPEETFSTTERKDDREDEEENTEPEPNEYQHQ